MAEVRIELSSFGAGHGFLITGPHSNAYLGQSVSLAGDVNSDGITDLIVGGFSIDDDGPNAGRAYVIYGRTGTPLSDIDLSNLSEAEGFVIQGGADGDFAGGAVSSAGDVNNDGIADLIVGAARNDDGGNSAGAAYIIFGTSEPTRGNIDLSSLSASDGSVLLGGVNQNVGTSVSSAGDINGDGIVDLIVGAPGASVSGAGAAYAIFGRSEPFPAAIDLTALSATDGFIVVGDDSWDSAGQSVSSAGDINGDGIDDLVVGAFAAGIGEGVWGPGEAYFIFGKAGATRGNIDLTTFSASDGFTVTGISTYDWTGFSVSSAGDINGDGLSDAVIGAPYHTQFGNTEPGKAFVIFGKTGSTRSSIDLSSLDPSDGFVIQGDEPADHAGFSVSSAGDVNGDNFDDIVIGSHYGDDGGSAAGEAYIIFGKAGSTRSNIDLSNLDANDGVVIQGAVDFDRAGTSVSGAGDINNDGFADVILSAP